MYAIRSYYGRFPNQSTKKIIAKHCRFDKILACLTKLREINQFFGHIVLPTGATYNQMIESIQTLSYDDRDESDSDDEVPTTTIQTDTDIRYPKQPNIVSIEVV